MPIYVGKYIPIRLNNTVKCGVFHVIFKVFEYAAPLTVNQSPARSTELVGGPGDRILVICLDVKITIVHFSIQMHLLYYKKQNLN